MDKMDKLPLPISIHPDEYLPGALARATSFNGHFKLSTIMNMSGLAGMAYSVAGKEPAAAAAIARVMAVDPAGVSRLWLNEVNEDWVNFFGTNIRKQHRLTTTRRVAPRRLAEGTPYVRAIWQLKPITFDTQNLERLLAACPVCHGNLGFLLTYGVAFCEGCAGPDEYGLPEGKVDLRDYPQEILPVEDRHALDFVTGLVDPDPSVRARPEPELHNDWKALTRGEIFETALALACVGSKDHRRKAHTIGRPASAEEYQDTYNPDAIATAGRMILDWPKSFNEFCNRMRESVSDRGVRGLKTEIGPIDALRTDPTLPEKARRLFSDAIDAGKTCSVAGKASSKLGMRRGDGMISQKDAIRKFGMSSAGLKRLQSQGLVTVFKTGSQRPSELLVESEIAEIAARTNQAYDIGAVSVRLGIPNSAVRALELASIIKLETHVTAFPTEREVYTRKSVEGLERQLIRRARANATNPLRPIKFLTAMGNCPGVNKPWANVVQAVLKRKVPVFEIGNESLPLFQRLAVSPSTRLDRFVDLDQAPQDPFEKITVPEAALILGASVNEARDLIAIGKMPPSPALTRGDAERVAAKYMFAREIGKRFAFAPGPYLVPMLAKLGLRPLFELRRGGRCGFSRADVEAALQRNQALDGELK